MKIGDVRSVVAGFADDDAVEFLVVNSIEELQLICWLEKWIAIPF